MVILRFAFLAFLAFASSLARADDILFVGNSFTFGAGDKVVQAHGGVPRLVHEIALAKNRQLLTFAVTAPGKDLSYHLAQPATEKALASKSWTWIVLQDLSTRPTHVGNIPQFLEDGEIFSDRIAKTSPAAGILLYETWARPPGAFYNGKSSHDFSSPGQMMNELHQAYGLLRDQLARKNPGRPVRVALVGTAFARVRTEYPSINLNATDQHHANAAGSYLAALVIYETIYHESVKGAPHEFFPHGELTIPTGVAAKLQQVADEVASQSP
jgi:hypothetical protein